MFWILLIGAFALFASYINRSPNQPEQIKNYGQFADLRDNHRISEISFVRGENHISIKGVPSNGEPAKLYEMIYPDTTDTEKLVASWTQLGIKVDVQNPQTSPWWMSLIGSILPVILLLGLWWVIMQQTQGGGNRVMSFGKIRSKSSPDDKQKITFADVAGVDEAKEELGEIVEFLKHPKRFIDMGARIPKGVLLIGPPGTGKTHLAKAVSGEAGVPFFSISGSDFVEMFVGVGASRVRDLFEQAKRNSPCIVFIDEIDAVGRHRGAGLGGGHDEREQTLNQLLVEMDGFGINEGVIILAATNRPDILDPALLRPGRFDRQVMVDRPDLKGRREILEIYVKNKPIAPDADLEILARRTPGFTGADLANLMNEAAILAARHSKRQIHMEELEESIERVIAGPQQKSRLMSEREKSIIAYHEAGHALTAILTPGTDPVHRASIIRRGRALAHVLQLPVEDRVLVTRKQILDEITILLGGRAAEELVFNELTSGASNDIERATANARRMTMEYGMSEELGPLAFGQPQHEIFLGRDISRERNYSEEVANRIDKEVRRIVDGGYQRSRVLLQANLEKLNRLAQRLIERETLEADEITAIIAEA